MDKLKIKILLEGGKIPEYKNPGDAGADVCVISNDFTLDGSYWIAIGETRMLSLGFRIAIPEGWEIQVRSRSGLAKRGLVVANAPGTIDSGYRGTCMVLLHNQSDKPFSIEANERVAQFILKKAPQADFNVVDSLDETVRGDGGFGSTGIQ